MADISKIDNGTEYNLKDATARAGIESSKTLKSSVVTVNDAAPINAEDITVDITPVQDLHGYDKPWAGGAWKNKLPMTVAGIKAANTSGTWNGNSYTVNDVTFNINTDNAGNVIGASANGTNNGSVIFFYLTPIDAMITFPGDAILSGCPNGGGTDSTFRLVAWENGQSMHEDNGSSVTIPSGFVLNRSYIRIASGYTVSNKTFYPMIRLATETDATFAPYSNICPIEGWTGAELDRVGKNLIGLGTSLNGYAGATVFQTSDAAIGFYFETKKLPDTITINAINGNRAFYSYYNEIPANGVAFEEKNQTQQTLPKTIAVNRSYKYVHIQFSYNKTDVTNIQVEKGSTPTAYEPYQGAQYTASFGETVYGGKWHVTEGGTDKTHGNIANYNGETINEPWLSSMDEYSPGATPTTGAQVVYPLTTPTTISTPKQNVPMLQGINTVSADCGDTQLKYQPDNVIGELKGEIQRANSFVDKMALREGSGAKDFSYGGWSFRLYIYRSMGQISMSVERISASSVTEQAVFKTFNGESDYRAPEELRPIFSLIQAATYTTPSGWAIQVYLKDDGYIMFTGMAPAVGASAPTSSNWNLVEPWATHQQAKDLFNN